MTYKKLFLDSDILLDWLLSDEPFSLHMQTLINECLTRKIKTNTSALIIANINFILSKRIGAANARQKIRMLINLISILPFENDIIILALESKFADFEDSIQFFIAKRYKCDAIITRNIKDYKHSTITVFTPEQFLRTL